MTGCPFVLLARVVAREQSQCERGEEVRLEDRGCERLAASESKVQINRLAGRSECKRSDRYSASVTLFMVDIPALLTRTSMGPKAPQAS